jgi:4-alpha-glucanotransferase
MKLTLRIRFHTRFGESLWLLGDHPLLGSGDASRALPMRWLNHDFWEIELNLPLEAVPEDGLKYSYLFRGTDGTLSLDWGQDRVLLPALLDRKEVVVIDSWNVPGFAENTFSTQPFRDVLLKDHGPQESAGAPAHFTHVFRIKAPQLEPGQTLCLVGSISELGSWNPANGIRLGRTPCEDQLSVSVDLSRAPFPIEYKYAVVHAGTGAFLRFEEGPNRILDLQTAPEGRVIVNDGFIRLPATTWRGAGVAIPVFSLRSDANWGVGDFISLKRLADWAASVGIRLIQILPVNDTIATHTWVDSYPYAAISAFALHPLYIDVAQVAGAKFKSVLNEFESERQRLNALEEIDYEAVMRLKLSILKRLYTARSKTTFRSKAYKDFFHENQHWLKPYALFCTLRDRFGTADYSKWPKHRHCTEAEIEKLTAPRSEYYDSVAFHFFVQFHLHTQLQEAAAHAHEKGAVLKGDIAIGVARHGADTWQHPELFHLDMQAGAPPDPFSDKGQNWGFPTYNWPRMQQDGFAWWKQRFAQMSHYFDAFRIDHILGFFRIWSIPLDAVEGILGRFVPAIPVSLSEFSGRGIAFDRERFLLPFINDEVLRAVFAEKSDSVKATFLDSIGPDRYRLKPEFATQRKIEEHFQQLEQNESNARLKLGLFDLVSNVLLFEAEKPDTFHFRFDIAKTASFQQLDPNTQSALLALYNDYFFVRQDQFWRDEAMQKLPVFKRVTNMLICGEDLGLVPASVPGVMKELGLLSLEIQRMPKTLGATFSRPADAPYLSVVTPSTHDMSTIRGWWEEDRALSQKFYSEELKLPGIAPEKCSGDLNELIVRQHLASPAMWCILQLQDWLGMDETLRRSDVNSERINIPANPKHYWRYRMHLTLEQLLAAEVFNRKVRELVRWGGRG